MQIAMEMSQTNIFAALFVIYACASTALYYYPFRSKNLVKIRHKKKFYKISHRGGAGENIENTIAAFDHSVRLGIDILELDCQLTKDGHVVVCHDNDLVRLVGFNQLISDTNYDDMPHLKNVQTRESDQGVHKIPLLETVFERYPNKIINLDIKQNNDELIHKVHDLIKKYEREDLTIWGNFSGHVKKKCFRLNPSQPLIFSKEDVAKLIIAYLTGYLPFMEIKAAYLEIPVPAVMLKRTIFRKSLIKHLQKRGVTVFLWVLDENDEFQIAMDLGVDGIMTDYPTKMIEYLKKSPVYSDLIVENESNEKLH